MSLTRFIVLLVWVLCTIFIGIREAYKLWLEKKGTKKSRFSMIVIFASIAATVCGIYLLISGEQASKNINVKVKKVEKKAKMSARNVTSTYDFNGAKRQTSGGKINLDLGGEVMVFQQMIEFAKAEDLPNLIKLCEKQIEKTPNWYTPYYYLGMAQADMGLKDEAIKNIRYAVDNTPGDPDYAKAREVLEILEQQN